MKQIDIAIKIESIPNLSITNPNTAQANGIVAVPNIDIIDETLPKYDISQFCCIAVDTHIFSIDIKTPNTEYKSIIIKIL